MTAKIRLKPTMASTQDPPNEERRNAASVRWSDMLSQLGYSQVVTAFYEFYPELSVTPLQALLLLNLVSLVNVKGQQAKMPYPSVKRLAGRLGSDERQVRRMLQVLEAKGLLKRQPRPRRGLPHRSNLYDLTPLIQRLEALCQAHPNRMRSKRTLETTADG